MESQSGVKRRMVGIVLYVPVVYTAADICISEITGWFPRNQKRKREGGERDSEKGIGVRDVQPVSDTEYRCETRTMGCARTPQRTRGENGVFGSLAAP